MKVYTEVNYEFKHGVLVEQSSKSYNYTGEVSLCKGLGGSAKDITDAAGDAVTNTQENVSGVLADNPVDINVPDASLITDNITGAMQDNPLASLTADINVPQINVPDASHAMSLLTTGLEKLGENTEYEVQGIVDTIVGVGERITKAAKKAVTGEGGYSDESSGDGDGPPGETGDETPDATLLTGSRKRELAMGRSFHSGSGSASKV